MRVARLFREEGLVFLLLATLLGPAEAVAEGCPGNESALGISRVLEIDSAYGPRYGTYQYPKTLALRPKEVVFTFDDGPIPERTPAILDALDQDCVKATFFAVGLFARTYPEIVRDAAARGHTLASHSWSHPANLAHLSLTKAKREIARGIASLKAIAPGNVAPFFRYPGLNDSAELNDHLARSDIAVISCDIGTDDWRNIQAKTIVKRTLKRLERKGKGILLFHDSKPETAKALPLLFTKLKERGYRVVHMVSKSSGIAALAGPRAPHPVP